MIFWWKSGSLLFFLLDLLDLLFSVKLKGVTAEAPLFLQRDLVLSAGAAMSVPAGNPSFWNMVLWRRLVQQWQEQEAILFSWTANWCFLGGRNGSISRQIPFFGK
jgi:hypothetical protein